jgi:hypothetical protein
LNENLTENLAEEKLLNKNLTSNLAEQKQLNLTLSDKVATLTHDFEAQKG